jgi:outer membrane lipoprotein-sorting protein
MSGPRGGWSEKVTEPESKARLGQRGVPRSSESGLMLLVALLVACPACTIKRTVSVQVPSRILQAKTATFQQLVALIEDYSGRIQSLSSTTVRMTFWSGKVESGKLQEYRSAPGYVLLRRPDSIRLSIQNPITKTSIADLASTDDDFSAWFPTENKFYAGKNSMKDLAVDADSNAPGFTARPIHIFNAILPLRLPLGESGYRIALEEAQDAVTKYYVLSVYMEEGGGRLIPVRKYWVDRADLAIALQQSYESSGALASTVHYANLVAVDTLMLPLSIKIDRPLDGYSLDLEVKDWRLNPRLPENAFTLLPPPGARRIQLKEKEKSEEP